MNRSLLTLVLSSAFVLTHVPSVMACINDSSTHRIEREFRNNYEFKAGDTEQKSIFEPQTVPSSNAPASWTRAETIMSLSGLGLALLATGLVVHTSER